MKFLSDRGFGGGSPEPMEFLWCFPKFSSCRLNVFPEIRGTATQDKLIIHYSKFKGVRWAKPPERQRKFKILEKNQIISMRFSKKLILNDKLNSTSIRKTWFSAEFLENSVKMSNFFNFLLFCHMVSETRLPFYLES